jgi:hypothetical protein
LLEAGMRRSAPLIAACAAVLWGCSHPTQPVNGFLSGDAVVSLTVECLALTVSDIQYQPIGLPDSLAVVGLRLHVEGTVVRDGVSTCQIPILQLTSITRAP